MNRYEVKYNSYPFISFVLTYSTQLLLANQHQLLLEATQRRCDDIFTVTEKAERNIVILQVSVDTIVVNHYSILIPIIRFLTDSLASTTCPDSIFHVFLLSPPYI